MATPFENVYGRFSIKVQDYFLDNLMRQQILTPATPVYNSFMYGLLSSAIPNYKGCPVGIGKNDRDVVLQQFNNTLEEEDEELLAHLMVCEWYEYQIKDVRQLSMSLSDTDFKRASESMNMKEKSKLLRESREFCDKLMVLRGYENIDYDEF